MGAVPPQGDCAARPATQLVPAARQRQQQRHARLRRAAGRVPVRRGSPARESPARGGPPARPLRGCAPRRRGAAAAAAGAEHHRGHPAHRRRAAAALDPHPRPAARGGGGRHRLGRAPSEESAAARERVGPAARHQRRPRRKLDPLHIVPRRAVCAAMLCRHPRGARLVDGRHVPVRRQPRLRAAGGASGHRARARRRRRRARRGVAALPQHHSLARRWSAGSHRRAQRVAAAVPAELPARLAAQDVVGQRPARRDGRRLPRFQQARDAACGADAAAGRGGQACRRGDALVPTPVRGGARRGAAGAGGNVRGAERALLLLAAQVAQGGARGAALPQADAGRTQPVLPRHEPRGLHADRHALRRAERHRQRARVRPDAPARGHPLCGGALGLARRETARRAGGRQRRGAQPARPVRRVHGVAAQDRRGEPRLQGHHVQRHDVRLRNHHAHRLPHRLARSRRALAATLP
mmetsp:Transcript_41133/g.136292  ORF Transcript_41133/g.136292 Transcript_41133/m.136292 type:complete len:467 (-) Transcript_41133:268-1668(-)